MRKLVWLLIVLAVLWGAWWATATTQMQSTLTGLLDTRRAAGGEVTLKDISKSGFPLAFFLDSVISLYLYGSLFVA